MIALRLLLYILLALAIAAAIFGLYALLLKILNRYADKIDTQSLRKPKKTEFDIPSLIIAGIMLIIAFLPKTNNILFLVMVLIFGLRSLYGKLSLLKGIFLFVGS